MNKMIDLKLEDNEFIKTEITHTRLIARAFVIDKDNKFIMLKVKRDDEFGKAEYLETSGGGVDEGEKIEEALLRELDEELGIKAEIITKIGVVDDYYNKIKRHNINHYFLAKEVSKTKIHLVSEGDKLIDSIVHLNIEDILNEYKNNRSEKINRLVYNREEPILEEIKKYLNI